MPKADKAGEQLGGGSGKVVEAKQTRKNQLEAIFAQMPTNIKPKPGAKKVGDK